MAIEILPIEQQAKGQFNGGQIQEHKPVAFPHESGGIKPFSTLFYWAHAWSDEGGLIDIHPHKGFEIMSYVVDGEIEHYDSLLRKWQKLKKGGIQIIRAGNGISHAEKLLPGSQIFQIWFDPDLEVSLNKPASYNDYTLADFPEKLEGGIKKRIYRGEDSPLKMDTDVQIEKLDFEAGKFSIDLQEDRIYACFLLAGKINIEKDTVEKGYFFRVTEQKQLDFEAENEACIFMISVPKDPAYKTYAQHQN